MLSERDLIFGSAYNVLTTGTTAGALQPVEPTNPDAHPREGVVEPKGGDNASSPWGFANLCGYGTRPPSTPATYLSAILDPVVAAARMFALNPIKMATPKLQGKQGAAREEDKKWIETTMAPLLTPYAEDAVWAVDMGWAAWQTKWKVGEGGRMLPEKLFSCLQESASGILVDKRTRDKIGVLWYGVELQGHKAFSYTHDRRAQQWLGRSRIENIIDAVEHYRDLDNKTAKMTGKAAGIVVMTGYPPGKDAAAAAANKTMAEAFGKAITSGAAYGSFPTLGGLTDDKIRSMAPADLVKFLELSLWQFRMLDLGDPGASIVATTAEKQYIDTLKCLGYGVPPEAVLMGAGGNRAKTESQGNSGTAMNEVVNRGIWTAFNEGVLNSTLDLNGIAPGTWWYEPEPLEDQQSVFDREILKMIAASDAGMSYLSKRFDLESIAKRNGLEERTKPLGPGEGIGALPASASDREGLRMAGYDSASANRIMGERALEDAERMMAAPPKGGKPRAA